MRVQSIKRLAYRFFFVVSGFKLEDSRDEGSSLRSQFWSLWSFGVALGAVGFKVEDLGWSGGGGVSGESKPRSWTPKVCLVLSREWENGSP